MQTITFLPIHPILIISSAQPTFHQNLGTLLPNMLYAPIRQEDDMFSHTPADTGKNPNAF